ncbi:MAG TPA: CHAD domain-containing protein, partial [Gemmatimonadales bacterium]
MTDRATDLLGRPAAQSVRLIAQGYLETATRALARLDDPADAKALHDFRVALRRLRTTLRAYRPLFEDSLGKKPAKQLGDIAESTNRVSEAEAALEWLRPLTTGLTPGERIGLVWLIDRIERRRVNDCDRCLSDVRRTFGAATRKLRKGLGAYRQRVGAEPSVTDVSFAGALT